jgi:hypothetical protein
LKIVMIEPPHAPKHHDCHISRYPPSKARTNPASSISAEFCIACRNAARLSGAAATLFPSSTAIETYSSNVRATGKPNGGIKLTPAQLTPNLPVSETTGTPIHKASSVVEPPL